MDQRAYEHRWLDKYLCGVDNGAEHDAPVRIFVMGVNEWRDEPTWPPPGVKDQAYFLHSTGRANSSPDDGRLTLEPPALDELPDGWTHDPFDPIPFLMPTSAAQLGGPDDYRDVDKRCDVLVYTGATLIEDVDVIGDISLRAFVATSARDTDVVARLIDLHPDGFAQRLCDGIVRLRYRAGMERAVTVTPDATYEVTIDMWVTAHRFLVGHAIRLQIASSAFPKYDRNLGTGGDMVTETHGVTAHNRLWHTVSWPSHLLLPVRS